MVEEWRPVPGYEGLYSVSSLGQVKKADGHMMRPSPSGNGYPIMKLRRNGKRTSHTLHGLVALAFLGPTPSGLEIRHKDGDKLNVAVTNLEFGTRSENNFDQVRHGTHANGNKIQCKHGHKFTRENTGRRPDGRYCRACVKINNDKRDQRKPIEARK